MAKLTRYIASLDLYQSSTLDSITSNPDLPGPESYGARIDGLGGKEFTLAVAGASNLVAGNLLQEPAENTGLENAAVATAAVVGQPYLNITNGSTTITSAAYAGGSIGFYTAGTVPIGDEYTIINVTGTLTNAGSMNVWLDRPLRYAVTTSATVVMKPSPYNGVIQMPATTPTGAAIGIAIWPITATYMGYIQTRGVASVLSDGSTFAVGSAVGTPSGTAGAVTVYAAATTKQAIGVAREAAASAHAISVNLTGF